MSLFQSQLTENENVTSSLCNHSNFIKLQNIYTAG